MWILVLICWSAIGFAVWREVMNLTDIGDGINSQDWFMLFLSLMFGPIFLFLLGLDDINHMRKGV